MYELSRIKIFIHQSPTGVVDIRVLKFYIGSHPTAVGEHLLFYGKIWGT